MIEMTAREAFMGILAAIAEADDEGSNEEYSLGMCAYEALPLFKGIGDPERKAVDDKVINSAVEYGPRTLLEASIRHCPPKLRPTAFVWGLDVALCDGGINEEERELLGMLQRAAGVSDEMRARVEAVLSLKYAGAGADLDEARAFYDVLMALEYEDKKREVSESTLRICATMTSGAFRGHGLKAGCAFFSDAVDACIGERAEALLADAIQRCPPKLKGSTFVWATELVIATREVNAAARARLDGMRADLGIGDELAARVYDVMSLKYKR